MPFAYILLPEAQEEYEASIMWYITKNVDTAEHFVNQVDAVLELVCHNPLRGKNNYHDFYEIRVKRFPFTVVYFIEETLNQIVVTSIFHDKRNPVEEFKE